MKAAENKNFRRGALFSDDVTLLRSRVRGIRIVIPIYISGRNYSSGDKKGGRYKTWMSRKPRYSIRYKAGNSISRKNLTISPDSPFCGVQPAADSPTRVIYSRLAEYLERVERFVEILNFYLFRRNRSMNRSIRRFVVSPNLEIVGGFSRMEGKRRK